MGKSRKGYLDTRLIVTGNMKMINWKKYKDKWRHLEGISFPALGRRTTVDRLIDMDYAELHFSIKDIRGETGELIAHLTPLGWTCIGNNNTSYECSQLGRWYFASETEESDQRADKLLRRFWKTKCGNEQQRNEGKRR